MHESDLEKFSWEPPTWDYLRGRYHMLCSQRCNYSKWLRWNRVITGDSAFNPRKGSIAYTVLHPCTQVVTEDANHQSQPKQTRQVQTKKKHAAAAVKAGTFSYAKTASLVVVVVVVVVVWLWCGCCCCCCCRCCCCCSRHGMICCLLAGLRLVGCTCKVICLKGSPTMAPVPGYNARDTTLKP